jgi:hypothetical protein
LLLLLGILPGLLYVALFWKRVYVCAQCGIKVGGIP